MDTYNQRARIESERSPERRSVFDFEQFGIQRTVALVDALASAATEADRAHRGGDLDPYGDLLNQAAIGLEYFANTSDQALDTYAALMNGASAGTRSVGAVMAPGLLRRNLDNAAAKERITRLLIDAAHSADALVQSTAEDSLVDAIYSDWIDTPTAQYLDSQLSEDRQRWS